MMTRLCAAIFCEIRGVNCGADSKTQVWNGPEEIAKLMSHHPFSISIAAKEAAEGSLLEIEKRPTHTNIIASRKGIQGE
jgi:hypothetical protein